MDGSKETVFPRDNRSDVHRNSQKRWQHEQDLHRFEPNGVPALRVGSEHRAPPLAKKLFAIDNLISKRTSVVYNGVSLGVSFTLQGRHQRKVNCKELGMTQCYFCGIFILFSPFFFVILYFFVCFNFWFLVLDFLE